jgi:hypothetical protein
MNASEFRKLSQESINPVRRDELIQWYLTESKSYAAKGRTEYGVPCHGEYDFFRLSDILQSEIKKEFIRLGFKLEIRQYSSGDEQLVIIWE